VALNFPNLSRSFDASRLRVRFWGHDASFEVSFFIAVEALWLVDPDATADEEGMLGAFDLYRDRIFAAAERAYRRDRRDSYTLSASDMN